MKKITGHIPELYEEEEELDCHRPRRRYFRRRPARKRLRRWRKG